MDLVSDHVSLGDWKSLRRCGIVGESDDKANLREILGRRINEEQVACFLNWTTADGSSDINRVQQAMKTGALPRSRRFGLWRQITVGDLLRYDPAQSQDQLPHQPIWRMAADHPFLVILGLGIAFLGVVATIFSEELRWIVTPPRTTLTLVLDGSQAMSELADSAITAWEIQRNIAVQKLPDPMFGDKERVAVWIQRGIPQPSGDCKPDFELKTKGYVPANQINLDILLEAPELGGETSPGKALQTAAARMRRFSLRPITHRAIVLTNSKSTCEGRRPIDDVCLYLADIATYWSSWSNTQLVHEIMVIDFGSARVGSTQDPCGKVSSIEVTSVDLSVRQPEESNKELCRIDAKLCRIPSIPTAAPFRPIPAPSPAPPGPTLAPSPAPMPTSEHIGDRKVSTPKPTIPTTTPAPTPPAIPTPTVLLKLRSLTGRRASITEGCNQGRVIGEIGALSNPPIQLESEVVRVPEDLGFLAQYGCVRVYTGILGDPSHGYAGYVQANDVCVSGEGYDYWIAQDVFKNLPSRSRLLRCEH